MRSKILSLLMLALLLSVAGDTFSAKLSERSPVRLGLWWDPNQSGSGFELFRGGDQIALIWYTYRSDGSPIWYTAAGRFSDQGLFEAPLLRFRWVDGKRSAPIEAGRVQLQRSGFESLTLHWTLDGRQGEQALQPFPLSGIVPEVDHSGAWFDPARSGFGLTLTEQGERIGAGLYFYDAAGEPTWRMGENGGRGTEFVLRGTTGRCPGCTEGGTQTRDEGRLQLTFDSELVLRATYTGASTAPWPLDGRLEQLSMPASWRPADRQLAAFDDAPRLRGYLDEAMLNLLNLRSQPGIDFSPAPATESFSLTNVQESGVDEADRLKTDGSFLYTFAKGPSGQDQAWLRVAEARDNGQQLVLRSSIPLPGADQSIEHSGLYLTENRLISLQGSSPRGYESLWSQPALWAAGSTRLTVFDRTVPSAPSLLSAMEFDAYLVASRRIGSRLYLVLRKTVDVPEGVEFGYPQDAARDARNREVLNQVSLQDWMPRVKQGGGAWQPLLDAKDVYLPVAATNYVTPEFVSVVAIDLAAPTSYHALAVAGPVAAVYVSMDRMYLATSRSGTRADPALGYMISEGFSVTDVHEIVLGERPSFSATGSVEGFLDRDPDRAPLRFSERAGKLRVVTVEGQWWGMGKNRLTVLEPSTIAPGVLRTLSYLPNRDRPAPLGKPNEMLYGTRYVGDRLYAVTFLKTDPLYVVDLSNPAAPYIAGEVQLPGFSDYLHPVGDKLLLGVGLDARPAQSSWGDGQFAWFQGLLFSLFDVSDPSRPRVLQQTTLGKRGSNSALLRNHHALSVLPNGTTTSFALPVRVHAPNGSEPPMPPDNYTYPWSWSGLQTLEVDGTDSTARLILGPALMTNRANAFPVDYFYDDAMFGGRSVLFTRGVVYAENGRFWRMDRDGTNVSGPY